MRMSGKLWMGQLSIVAFGTFGVWVTTSSLATNCYVRDKSSCSGTWCSATGAGFKVCKNGWIAAPNGRPGKAGPTGRPEALYCTVYTSATQLRQQACGTKIPTFEQVEGCNSPGGNCCFVAEGVQHDTIAHSVGYPPQGAACTGTATPPANTGGGSTRGHSTMPGGPNDGNGGKPVYMDGDKTVQEL